jgi:hypothetical protein
MHRRIISILCFFAILWGGSRVLAVEFTIAWDPNSEPSLAGYNLYAMPAGSAEGFLLWKTIDLSEIDPAGPMITVDGFDTHRKYTFFVTAFDDVGNESPGSNAVCGWKGIPCATAERDAPDPPADGWTAITGRVSVDQVPICAAVLVNGQHGFSCDPEQGVGTFQMGVPLDADNTITVQAFAGGLEPFRRVYDANTLTVDVDMQAPLAQSPTMTVTVAPQRQAPLPQGWARIAGAVRWEDSPVCAMVLANGQHTLSCGPYEGAYGLSVPLDPDGQITVFAFAHGFQPHKETLTPTW